MAELHNQDYHIQIKKGTHASIKATAANRLGVEGEPAYTTDKKRLHLHDGTVFNPVQTLDMAVTNNDEIISNNGEIVFVE